MNAPIKPQVIMQDGKPAFVVIPYAEYIKTFPRAPRIPENGTIPQEVLELMFDNDWTIQRAWREYLGYTQTEIAAKLGVTQPALAQLETSKRLRKSSKANIAAALGIQDEQLL